MSISIQTNVNSLVAQQNLSVTNKFQSQTISQLTSGYRINSSGDDAAGLAVANKFRSSVAELMQGVANGNDAVAQLQIMDGGMNNISLILDRLKTLATQSASGTLTGGDATRKTLNNEFQTDLAEIDRQAQSIGLDTGGTFAKSLDVYLGQGSGSANTANGIVGLSLAASTVDSKSLGMNSNGMQVVNGATYSSTGQVVTLGSDIGNASTTSVVAIIGNSTNIASEAVGSHAAFQFSGAGFSDSGKINISASLTGVTDVATLVTNVNKAIGDQQILGTGAAAAAFKNANIVASVFTDSKGAQAIAFTSSNSAFQVQAGDQMANALLGNIQSNVAGNANLAKGTVVTGATTLVTGATTSTSTTFANNQVVKLVVTGGGLASPSTFTLNTGGGITTAAALLQIGTAFATGTPALAAAGLTTNASTAVAGSDALTFNSKTGQAFNIQVTGDTANLLGLGSYLTDANSVATTLADADYSTITATNAYAPTTATGSANFQISLNGGVQTSLTAIDLSTGAGALAATLTGSTLAAGANNPTIAVLASSTVTFTSTGAHVFGNSGVALTLQSTIAATSGKTTSSLAAAPITATFTDHNLFTIKVDGGGGPKTVSVDLGPDVGNGAMLNDLNGQLGAAGAHAFLDAANNNKLTIVSDSVGTTSSIEITSVGGATVAELGINVTGAPSGAGVGAAASARLSDIATQIQNHLGTNAVVSIVNVSGNDQLQIQSAFKGVGENFTFSASANTGSALGLGVSAGIKTGTSSSIADVISNLNQQFNSDVYRTAGLHAVATGADGTNGTNTFITIQSKNGTQFRLNSSSTSATGGNVGFGGSAAIVANAGTSLSSAGTSIATLDAYGVSQSKALSFTAMVSGDDTQALTFSAKGATGALETQTITLANNALTNRAGVSVDDAVAYINQQLQAGSNAALKNIVAVKEIYTAPITNAKSEGINFVSSLAAFTVGVAGTSNANGVNGGVSGSVVSSLNQSGSNFAIDTQAGAQAAVTALAAAVSALGVAQAAVGKGQNQLSYGIALAQSQITNFSAAESQIRDANVAVQAANLSKAQVLSQASIAAMAQANSAPQAVLALLRG